MAVINALSDRVRLSVGCVTGGRLQSSSYTTQTLTSIWMTDQLLVQVYISSYCHPVCHSPTGGSLVNLSDEEHSRGRVRRQQKVI